MIELATPLETTQPAAPATGRAEVATLSARAAGHLLATAVLTTQFAYVYDHPGQALVFVSAGVGRLLGEQPAAADLTLAWFAGRLHPADAPAVAQAQALLADYLRARQQAPLPGFLFSLDYRLRHADGHYRRVLHECRLLARDPATGAIRRTLALFTDLTHHKLTTDVRVHCNQPDFAAFAARRPAAAPALTPREQQVLALVLRGFTSRQVAYHLRLSAGTVQAHRRNLLRKAATHSFHGLLAHVGPT